MFMLWYTRGTIKLTETSSHEATEKQAHAIAELIGGTLIMVDVTNCEAMIAGGDLSKLEQVAV